MCSTRAWSGCRDTLTGMAFDTPAAVKTLTDTGADEAFAVAVVEVAREASTEATGELVTRGALRHGARTARVPLSLAPGYGRHSGSASRVRCRYSNPLLATLRVKETVACDGAPVSTSTNAA